MFTICNCKMWKFNNVNKYDAVLKRVVNPFRINFRCRYYYYHRMVFVSGMEPNTGNGEDLMTLEAEISELQRENARVESQMLKLKSDINAMESHLGQGEKVNLSIH